MAETPNTAPTPSALSPSSPTSSSAAPTPAPAARLAKIPGWLRSWEALLTVLLIFVILRNIQLSPGFLTPDNLINLFTNSIEKVIVALIMTFVIINGEIDLSVASVMGLSGCLFGWLIQQGVALPLAFVAALVSGLLCGAFNGFWTARVGLPSLVVTLAGLIGYRGIARLLLEDNSLKNIPEWYINLGTKPTIGPLPLTIVVFAVLFVVVFVTLHYSAFGRYVFAIGSSKEAARFSGIRINRVKMTLFIASGGISALAGLFYVMRLGAVRADLATGFELDIITMVLLGGVSIFGGTGTLLGVGLSLLLVLSIRNGMTLDGVTGNTQSAVIGALLILSVLVPNLLQEARQLLSRRVRSP
jgi:rhamnose transport system permease protein